MTAIHISYVLTIFNKADALPATLAALKKAHGALKCEYIFVDDASTDNSVDILRKNTRDWDNTHILINHQNEGPSKRLNQGAALACGDVLMLIDGDDIILKGSVDYMYRVLKSHSADLIYGRFKRFKKNPENTLFVSKDAYHVSKTPFHDILRLGYTGMAVMVKRSLFEEAKGADERLFIQDQSLALRLGFHSKKMVCLEDEVVYATTPLYSLSKDLRRQHHDGFFAFLYALRDFGQEERLLYAKMVSVLWKAKRSRFWWWPFFVFYGLVKWVRPRPFGLVWFEKWARDLLAPHSRYLSNGPGSSHISTR